MDIINIAKIITMAAQTIAVVFTIGAPFVVWRIWKTTDGKFFVVATFLFWLITVFVTGVTLILWLDTLPAFDCV
jgi:hypothetical protein